MVGDQVNLSLCHVFYNLPLLFAHRHHGEARQAQEIEAFQFCAGFYLRERDRPRERRD